jgi:uncharacterized Fe-S radical SAM superfamily protein PflX
VGDFGSLSVWQDSSIRGALSWYLAVAENRRHAKFRIAATLATDIDPATCSEEALWAELDRLTPIFVERWQAIRAGALLPEAAEGPSLLWKLNAPMLWNSNFFMTLESMKILGVLTDVGYLTSSSGRGIAR